MGPENINALTQQYLGRSGPSQSRPGQPLAPEKMSPYRRQMQGFRNRAMPARGMTPQLPRAVGAPTNPVQPSQTWQPMPGVDPRRAARDPRYRQPTNSLMRPNPGNYSFARPNPGWNPGRTYTQGSPNPYQMPIAPHQQPMVPIGNWFMENIGRNQRGAPVQPTAPPIMGGKPYGQPGRMY